MTAREYLISQNKLQNSYTLDEVIEILNDITAKSISITPYKNFKHMIDEEFGTAQEFSKAIRVHRKTGSLFITRPFNMKIRHLMMLKKKGIDPVNLITLNDMDGEE